ncbi:glycosyltransferase family 4 protein [Parabacteroides sp.]
MKVVFTMGGITHYLSPLLDNIVRKGVDVVMVIPSVKDNRTIGKGVKLINSEALYQVRYSEVKQGWHGKTILTDLKMILDEEKPDIVVLGWPYFLQYFFDRQLRLLIKKNNIKLVIREIPFQVPPFGHLDYFKENPVYDENMVLQSRGMSFFIRALCTMYIRKFVYKHADATINYASCAYDILPSYGVNRDKIFVTYNTSDTESLLRQREAVLSAPPLLEKKQRILHIGRLVKWKRVDLLIDAYAKIYSDFPNSELTIIGNGPEKENLQSQVERLGLKGRVAFAGAIYDPFTLGQYMHESSIYVLAGMGGLSINEAMCYSLPVICSVCDGTEKDLVQDGVNGYYFENGNVDSLAKCIEYLLRNPQIMKAFGDVSLKKIQEEINLDTVSSRFVEAFEKTLFSLKK